MDFKEILGLSIIITVQTRLDRARTILNSDFCWKHYSKFLGQPASCYHALVLFKSSYISSLYVYGIWNLYGIYTVHVQQNIFEETLAEVCSPHLYALVVLVFFSPQCVELFPNVLEAGQEKWSLVIKSTPQHLVSILSRHIQDKSHKVCKQPRPKATQVKAFLSIPQGAI